MERALNIQTVGSTIVIATIVASEASAVWLTANPGSSWAWYLNIEVFGVFERVRAEQSPLYFLFGPASLELALSALLLVWIARFFRFRFGLAFAANLSFCFAIGLAFAAKDGATPRDATSLLSIIFRPNAQALPSFLLFASFGAAVASHLSYFFVIRSENRKALNPVPQMLFIGPDITTAANSPR